MISKVSARFGKHVSILRLVFELRILCKGPLNMRLLLHLRHELIRFRSYFRSVEALPVT